MGVVASSSVSYFEWAKRKDEDKMAFSASFRPVNRVLVKKWKAQKKDADNEWMVW